MLYAVVKLPDGTIINIPVPFENEGNEEQMRDRFYDWFIENSTLEYFEDENGNKIG